MRTCPWVLFLRNIPALHLIGAPPQPPHQYSTGVCACVCASRLVPPCTSSCTPTCIQPARFPAQAGLTLEPGQQLGVAANAAVGRYVVVYTGMASEASQGGLGRAGLGWPAMAMALPGPCWAGSCVCILVHTHTPCTMPSWTGLAGTGTGAAKLLEEGGAPCPLLATGCSPSCAALRRTAACGARTQGLGPGPPWLHHTAARAVLRPR